MQEASEQSMVERVARALDPYAFAPYAGSRLGRHLPLLFKEMNKHRAFTNARAAIAAMREPTEAMMAAGYGEISWHDNGHQSADIWRAMIDEALKE